MNVNEAKKRQFKAYGYIRIGLYAVIFFFSALFWSGLIVVALARIPVVRLFGNFFYFSFALILVMAGLTAFWLVNRWLIIVPTLTQIAPDGFRVNAPYRRENELFIHFSEIGTIFELGFGTLVTVNLKRNRRSYSLIFGKDTDGYHRLLDTLKDGLNEFRTAK